MSAQRAPAPVRVAAFVAAAAAVVLAAVLAVRVAGRREPPRPPDAPPPPSGAPVDRKERVRHEEFREGRLAVSVRGDLAFRGADGRERLTGSVEVVRFSPAGEAAARLTADEVAYAKGGRRFEIAGRVRIEAGGAALEGEAFLYDEAAGTFGTVTGGRFTADGLAGEAREIVYDERAGEVRLGGGFRAGLAAADGGTLTLAGEALRYERGPRRGRMTGPASLAAEDYRAEAATVSFLVGADEAGLEAAVLEGGAEVVLGERAPSGAGGEVRAGLVEVAFARGPFGLAVRASGGAVLSSRSGAGNVATVTAPAVLADFSRAEGLRTWSASGGVRAETGGRQGPGRVLLGEEARFDAAGVLRVSGPAGGRAAADSAEARVEAPAIEIAAGAGDLAAEGGVGGVIKKDAGNPRSGFFAWDEDVSFSCRTLRMTADGGAIGLSGDVLVRQGSAAVRGGEIELTGGAGQMTGGKGVTITVPEAGPGERSERMVELAGREMAFSPDTRTLSLSGGASVGLPGASLEAGSLAAVLAPDGREVATLTAEAGVVVTRGGYTGRARAAFYDAAAGRLVLTGSPVLTDAGGGAARGDKLTFDLADDKIFLENEGTGRTATVIRS